MSTESMGLHNRKNPHVRCRRCGSYSYNARKHYCSHCGYGKTSKIRSYSWLNKDLNGIRKR
ncbi:50S ribosomal protein L37e [Candidatus Parvarchaeota archaeon]|nr:50S ribosomal protein L37e [Candidatus Acidifodinimicrobium mancum]